MTQEELISGALKEIGLEVKGHISQQEILAELARQISHLISQDFDRLVTLLYRVDVDEKKLRMELAKSPERDAGELIAELIFERQLQKIKTRTEYARGNQEGNEEKW
jgi:adenylate cyclase class IV